MEKTNDNIWNKKNSKLIENTNENILLEFTMYKKGLITKNKRYF